MSSLQPVTTTPPANMTSRTGSDITDAGGGGGGGEEELLLRSISPVLLGVMSSLALFGIVIAVAFLTFNIRFRHSRRRIFHQNRLIKMSSPNLNILIAVGAVLIYACVVLFGVDVGVTSSRDVLRIVCQARICLLTVGFTLVYGSMFSKAWRVYRIFAQAAAKRMVIRDTRLVTMVGALLLVDVIVLVIWLVFDPPTVIEKTVQTEEEEATSSSPQEGVLVCQSQLTAVWLSALYVVKAAVLLLGTYLSWKIRNVTVPSMDDAQCIVVSVYTCVILAAAVTSLAGVLEVWPNALYSCLAVAMLVCPTEMLLLQYIPKIRAWRNNPEASYSMSHSLTASYLATAERRSFTEVQEELFLLSKENASLKRALSQKDNTIKVLHEHVGSAREKIRLLAIDPEARQDSGCDFDMSSSSTCPEETREGSPPEVVREDPECEETDNGGRLGAVPDDPLKLSVKYGSDNDAALERQQLKRRRARGDGSGSVRSVASVSSQKSIRQFEDLRESIVKELHQAHDLSRNLRESIAHDLHSCRSTPMYMVIADNERGLAGVLKDSYDLDGDNLSMSSSTFTYDNPVFSRNQQHRRHSVHSFCTCGDNCHHSSFRSLASVALSFQHQEKTPDGQFAPSVSRDLRWPHYIPPQTSVGCSDTVTSPRVLNNQSEELKVGSTTGSEKRTKSVYHTYV